MDQIKIGRFLQELRKEKGCTQEQLAEMLNVSRRTVSRWETGSNLPDLDLLIELTDYYSVELRELLDGERKNMNMDQEMKETVLRVAEYSNDEKQRSAKIVLAFFAAGIIGLAIHLFMQVIETPDTFWVGFIKGITFGIALGSMILGILYITGRMEKTRAFKMRLLGKEDA